jgi:hypothetical protein
MEIPGEVFLFNFSLLAITFSAVSAVVMLLRQTMGGKLSNFDVFLVNAYVAHGFVLAIAAILPPLIAQFELPLNVVFVISSVIAALLMTLKSGNTMIQRKSITKKRYADFDGNFILSPMDYRIDSAFERSNSRLSRCCAFRAGTYDFFGHHNVGVRSPRFDAGE